MLDSIIKGAMYRVCIEEVLDESRNIIARLIWFYASMVVSS